VGPYYAMFPTSFASRTILQYTRPGDLVLDPFAGRGTSIFSAVCHERRGIGVEINPVGWVYSQTKLKPAAKHLVLARLKQLHSRQGTYEAAASAMPRFFHCCYDRKVLAFLLAARKELHWRSDSVDRTAMAFLLINLHGKRDDSLSNQMRQTKSLSPRYAIRWWAERDLRPPRVDVLDFLTRRIEWRYAKGRPEVSDGNVHLGDSIRVLPQLKNHLCRAHDRVRLLLTSPPYYGVTNYHYDQWLRLWLLGGEPSPRRIEGAHRTHRGKFENKEGYRGLLIKVFMRSKVLLANDTTVYIRTDRRQQTLQTTADVLAQMFPRHEMTVHSRPHRRPTQTRLFGHADPRVGEVDFILTA
jgi:hypothetical protein